jgi:hypothetical protein
MELSKKLVDRVYVYRAKPYEVTFKRMKEKQLITKYL